MKLAILLAFSVPLWAQTFTLSEQHQSKTALRFSQGALLAATLADALSSRGMVERNPILGRGDFSMRNQGAKAISISVGLVVAESLIVRRWPSTARVFKYTNWIVTGSHSVAAVSNMVQR